MTLVDYIIALCIGGICVFISNKKTRKKLLDYFEKKKKEKE